MSSFGRTVHLVLSRPLTWMAVATIGVLDLGFIRWFQPSPPMSGVLIGLSVSLLVLWIILLVRSAKFSQLYFETPDEFRAEFQENLTSLEIDLEALGATQGVEQIHKLEQSLDTMTDVLKLKLNSGELAYGRYLGTAQQVYHAAIDNLQNVVIALTSVKNVDREYVQRRLRDLEKIKDCSEEQKKETTSLAQRLSLLDRQLQKSSDMLSQNESAMTVLVNASTALADTNTGKTRTSVDAETAMAELEMLAKRAGKYATTS